MLALEVRVARLQHWTLTNSRCQPYEDLLLIAADHLLENEHHQKDTRARPGGATRPASHPGRTTKTIEYRLRPKD